MKEWKYQPAGDNDLPPARRISSPRRESSLITALVGLAWWILVRLYLKVYHRLEVFGRDQLPRDPGFFVVANHASHLDALVLAAMLPLRWNGHVYPVAAGDTFFESTGSAVFASQFLNALPLWRRKIATHALEDLRERTQRDVLILFPEGTRSRSGELQKFKPGIGRILAASAAQAMPCHIAGAFEAWPPGKRFPLPRKIRVRIGEPLCFQDTPGTREGWEAIATTLHEAVSRLESGAGPEPG